LDVLFLLVPEENIPASTNTLKFMLVFCLKIFFLLFLQYFSCFQPSFLKCD